MNIGELHIVAFTIFTLFYIEPGKKQTNRLTSCEVQDLAKLKSGAPGYNKLTLLELAM